MNELDVALLTVEFKTVLETYWQLQLAIQAEDKWVPRVLEVPQVQQEQLTKIHGKLLAYGYLKCEVLNRDLGVVYQLTSEGRKQLQGTVTTECSAESAENDTADLSQAA